jgi:hypothetical protein
MKNYLIVLLLVTSFLANAQETESHYTELNTSVIEITKKQNIHLLKSIYVTSLGLPLEDKAEYSYLKITAIASEADYKIITAYKEL